MAHRSTLPARITITGDHELGRRLVPYARTLLGTVVEVMARDRLPSHTITRRVGDVRVMASHDGINAVITIAAPARGGSSAAAETPDVSVWIPRGFVVYPANDSARAGWGMPVVPSTALGTTPYSGVNLAPGLDVGRWTSGGPLGQVLVTQQPNAGYASAENLIAPLMFHAVYGLRPSRAVAAPSDTGSWAAYRIEFRAFTAQSPGASETDQRRIIEFKRGVFEAVNEHRVSIGRDALSLPIRGLYDSAQATAECMWAVKRSGHFSDAFPPTYKTRDDRMRKDGMIPLVYANIDSRNEGGGENVVTKGWPPLIDLGPDPQGVPMFSVPNSAGWFGAQEAFDAWMDSPPHKANIESAQYDIQPTAGYASCTDIGIHENFAVQHFEPRSEWVYAGNRFWNSKHAEVPTISWNGFHSLNLGWETFPCQFNNTPPGGAGTTPTIPLQAVANFTAEVDGADVAWLYHNYGDGTRPVSAMSPFIYARGRIIAVAPMRGLVWAAAVQRLDGTPTTHRLIAITHHAADQPSGITSGMTAIARVWYCDIPELLGLAVNPQSPIRGVYGAEDEGWPWDQVNSPFSWRGGQQLDVGTSDGVTRDLLKYGSQWVFDSEGRNAACSRNRRTFAAYASFNSPVGVYTHREVISPNNTVLTLNIGSTGGALDLTLNWLGVPPAATERNYDPSSSAFTVSEAVLAVGYDVDDNLSCCFAGGVRTTNPFDSFDWVDTNLLRFFRWGTPDSVWAYGDPCRFFSRSYYAGGDLDVEANYVNVLDVLDRVTVRVGTKQRWRFVESPPGSGSGYLELNPDYEACWTYSSADVVNVTVWRDLAPLHTRWFPNPDDWFIGWGQLCYRRTGETLWGGTQLVRSINTMVLASYAVTTSGEWMLSYVVQPQTAHLWYRVTAADGLCAWGACTPAPSNTVSVYSFSMPYARRGGFTLSSVASNDDLMSMTQTPGPAPVFLYARAV